LTTLARVFMVLRPGLRVDFFFVVDFALLFALAFDLPFAFALALPVAPFLRVATIGPPPVMNSRRISGRLRRGGLLHARVVSLHHHALRLSRIQSPVSHDPDTAPHRHAFTARRIDGERLGAWRLVRSLGRGGMGEVFLAERVDAGFKQRAAIKLMGGGRVSPNVAGRMRLERQILASLEHPNIARLLDGGALPDGTPFIVMEYVDGEPIDVYCDTRRLGVDARIDLFRTVCAAVHCAHQNLVVHRDLKPSNILVTEDGVPKLLDFGIAKLLDTRAIEHTLAVTHADFRMLTPDHASPEQVRGEPVTTASDVYVLGVLLHELLTGSRPFDIKVVTFSQIERAICEQPAIAPSAAIARLRATDAETAEHVAACRSTTPARLERRLADEIDTIVGMAMRKEPQRRYGSALELAEDLRRHRAGQPVIARADTRYYRTRKFIARHRFGVGVAGIGVLMLAGFAIAMSIQATRIARERDTAAAERSRAEQVSSFLVELFELSDPLRPDRADVTAREVLDVGARRITHGLRDQPETRALLLETIGRVYGNLGMQDRARELLSEAVETQRSLHGVESPEVAVALRKLGDSLIESGDYAQAEHELGAALSIEDAISGPDSAARAATHHSLGRLEQQRGELDDAATHYRRAIEIDERSGRAETTSYASILNDYAGLLTHRGRYDEAERLYRKALSIDTELLGEDHPQVGQHLQSLAVVRHLAGDLDGAGPLYAQSVALLERVLGESHPQTIDALGNYGRFLNASGDRAAAETLLRRALALDIEARGPRHPYVGYDHVNLAFLLYDDGRFDAAERHFHDALDIYGETLPADHLYVASAHVGLGRTLAALGQLTEGRAELERGLSIWTARVPADHPQRIEAAAALAAVSGNPDSDRAGRRSAPPDPPTP
jgi:serine/threonine-protein kinase